MIANVSKNNTGKLLVAVLAMAMIVAGAAVVLGGSVSAAPAFNDEKTEVTVSTSEDLLTAIDGVNNSTGDYASVTTIILDGDEFDVTKASGNYIGSGFVISKDNITIRGADGTQPLIYADYSNSGMGTIDGINQQNTVTISGDNVTLQNLKIANMYTFIQVVDQSTQEVTDQYYDSYKSVEFTGNGATFSNVDLVHNDKGVAPTTDANGAEMPADIRVLSPTWGGVLMVSNDSENTEHGTVTLKDVTVENGVINFAWLQDTGSVNMVMDNVVLNVNDADGAGINYGNNPDANVTYQQVDLKINLNSADSRTTSVINQAPAGTTINVNAPVKLTGETTNNEGVNIVLGTNGSIDKNGFEFTNNGTMESTPSTDALGLRSELETDLTITTPAFLANNLTIREGATLTIASTGYLELNGYTLTIEGTLVVNNGGSIIAIGAPAVAGGSEGIVLTGTGVITNNGVIGKGSAVTVSGEDGGSVSLQNVTGISFGLQRTVDQTAGAQYTLTFSGNAVRNGTGTFAITASNGAIVSGDLNIGNDVVFTSDGAIVSNGSTLTVNGTVGGTVELQNGATIVLNGKTDGDFTVTAKTGEYISSERVTSLTNYTDVIVNNVSGITLTVDSVVSTQDIGGEDTSVTEQRLLLSGNGIRAVTTNTGTITVAASSATQADKFDGIYIVGSFTYTSAQSGNANVSFNVQANVIVTGQITSGIEIVTTETAGYFTGTAYSVTADVSGVQTTTYYVTGFDQAFGQIDSAVGKTITVYGELEISDVKNLAAGQTINTANAEITITETGEIEMAAQSVITDAIDKVEGKLTVIYGASCPEPVEYDVKTTNDAGDIVYSGLAIAIADAQEGDVINVVKDAHVTGSLTIPAGITVDINVGGSLTVDRNLTVNGTLDNHGEVSVGRAVAVSGTIDNTEATGFTAAQNEYEVTVSGTGSIVFATAPTWTGYNGAYYTNEDTYVVLTTLANAVASVAEYDIIPGITVIGNVSENTEVVSNADITIADEATVSVGTLTIDECDLIITGTFSGTVVGAAGEEGATVESGVRLNQVTDMTVSNSVKPNASNINVWTMGIKSTESEGELSGTVEIVSGTVTVADDMAVADADNAASKLTVASDATLVIPDEITLTSTKGVSVAGTLSVIGTFTATDASVSGTVDIAVGGAVTATNLVVTGTVNVASNDDNENGTLTIAQNGKIVLGEKPDSLGVNTTGAINGLIGFTDASGMIKAYAGADMSGATYGNNVTVVSTEYQINGTAYMTVYALSGNSIGIVDTAAADKIELAGFVTPMEDEAYAIVWYNGEKTVVAGDYIGGYDVVSTEFEVSDVFGTISEGNGLTMYIDGLTISNWYSNGYFLTVGTHTVSIAANAGYNADNAVITFNGQTIANGGTITIEAGATSFTLAASGAVPAQSVAPSGDSSDDGLGLTDILLIILVVLIVIMAVIVALRLMRS